MFVCENIFYVYSGDTREKKFVTYPRSGVAGTYEAPNMDVWDVNTDHPQEEYMLSSPKVHFMQWTKSLSHIHKTIKELNEW